MNKIILIGNLTKDPELIYGNSEKPFVKFTIAVKRPFTQDKTDFINCVANRGAENIANYCFKGSKVAVEGVLTIDNKDGSYFTNVRVSECEFLTPKNQQGGQSRQGQNQFDDGEPQDIGEDDLPF
jgi:single-strand DNA-binding protein